MIDRGEGGGWGIEYDHRLFMASHLVRAWSSYEDMRIRSFHLTHTHTHTHTLMHACACTHTHMHARTYASTHVCVHTHTHTHMQARMHACTHICIHTHACMHVHTHTHTHTHTHNTWHNKALENEHTNQCSSTPWALTWYILTYTQYSVHT